jgi:hypothetical protein
MKKLLLAVLVTSPILADDAGEFLSLAPARQAAFVESFWLACDLLDESGYTAAHPLPSYDWPTLKRKLLPILYWCDAHAKATAKANLIAAIAVVKMLADEPGVDTSRIR